MGGRRGGEREGKGGRREGGTCSKVLGGIDASDGDGSEGRERREVEGKGIARR